MQSFAERGLDFAARCPTLPVGTAVEEFLTIARETGFDSTACGAWAGVGRNRRHRFFFLAWPQEWADLYNKNRYFEIDPFPVEARRRIAPFLYSEVKSAKLTPAQQSFYTAALEFGWREGLGVPIHGPGSLQGLVAMATRRDNFTITARDRAVLEIMCRTIWERCRISEGFGLSGGEKLNLSAREIECLQWAAVGKSDGDIATLIGIKPATAHFHIEQAKKRLGVKTRVEAVAVGVLHGII